MKKTVVKGRAIHNQVKRCNIRAEGNCGKECEKGIHVGKTETCNEEKNTKHAQHA